MAMLAARRIGESGNAERLAAAYDRLVAFRAAGGGTAFLDARRNFYDTLIDIGGNRQLARLMPLMQIQLLRMQFLPFQTDIARQRQFEGYEAMYRAVRAGDARLADRLAKLHVRRTRLHLMRLPDQAFQAHSS
jgi:DNA-binding GntR family transcriptional regulator